MIDLAVLEAPPDKVIAETSMLLRAAISARASDLSRRSQKLGERLVTHARSVRVLAGIALHPGLAQDYAAAHLVLGAAGWPDPDTDAILTASLSASSSASRERPPHRELEQIWLGRLRGGPAPTPDLLSRTALGTGIDVLTGSRDDVYALTHSVLYATDFGGELPPLPRSADRILSEARSALAGALDDDDFDLAGELLLLWPLLNAEWDPTASFGFQVLAHVEDEVGLLPSLAMSQDDYLKKTPEARQQYVAAAGYHTAYVMGLLCAVILRKANPPTAVIRSSSSSEAVETLREELGRSSKPQWLQIFESMSDGSRRGLALLVLDVAIRRAVRRCDYMSVRRVLDLAVRFGLTGSPSVIQAAQLLTRLARLPIDLSPA